MKLAALNAIRAFRETRRLASALKTRGDVLAWREERLERFLKRAAPKVGFYRGTKGKRLEELPVVDKATVLANFERMNVGKVTLAEARAALDAGRERVRGYIVGQSTGTSGNRGVFVISEAERFTWLGVMLAKTLPDAMKVKHRVALALPGYGELYASATETGKLAVRFFDLARGVAAWRDEMIAWAPDVIVAPPKVLRVLAQTGLKPRHVFSGAEVLDPLDRAAIEAGFGVVVREIYMATEGLFGVACERGVLHLAEDVVAFEFVGVAGSELVTPLVTDFTRRTQIMARYRMNDLLRLRAEPCACGSPLQAVASVEGRVDDVFELRGANGEQVMVTPDVMRNAVVDADRRILDFRILQTDANEVELALASDLPAEAALAAAAALQGALERIGAVDVAVELRPGIEAAPGKLRRVRREFRG